MQFVNSQSPSSPSYFPLLLILFLLLPPPAHPFSSSSPSYSLSCLFLLLTLYMFLLLPFPCSSFSPSSPASALHQAPDTAIVGRFVMVSELCISCWSPLPSLSVMLPFPSLSHPSLPMSLIDLHCQCHFSFPSLSHLFIVGVTPPFLYHAVHIGIHIDILKISRFGIAWHPYPILSLLLPPPSRPYPITSSTFYFHLHILYLPLDYYVHIRIQIPNSRTEYWHIVY